MKGLMKMKFIVLLVVSTTLALSVMAGVHGIPLDTSDDRVESPLRVNLKRIGTMEPRTIYDVKSSHWTIGCEGLDRDFANFWEYAEFLEPLGIRNVRLQTGWAKTEKTKGVYDFAWLDEIVDFFAKRGYTIMLEPGYGNPLYTTGWDIGTGLPDRGEALAAWDRYVVALVNHYRDRVHEWATWNEASNMWAYDPRMLRLSEQPGETLPDTPGILPFESATFCKHTANLILKEQPEAKIACLTLGSTASSDEKGIYVEEALRVFGEDAKRYTWIIVHGYKEAPEDAEPGIRKIRQLIERYAPNLRLRQGEQGCPSEWRTGFAMRNKAWSEYSQSKWMMRRMLFDRGLDIPALVFTMSDLHYGAQRKLGSNPKGLIRSNARLETIGVKRVYYAVQNVVSLFDDTLERLPEPLLKTPDCSIRNYTYRKSDGRIVQVFWVWGVELPGFVRAPRAAGKRPGDSFETRPIVLQGPAKAMEDPVWVDLFTGRIYEFPKRNMVADADDVTFMNVPAYDSPCVLTERSVVMDLPKPTRPVEEVFERTRAEIREKARDWKKTSIEAKGDKVLKKTEKNLEI